MKRHNVALRKKDLARLLRFDNSTNINAQINYDALIARACMNTMSGNLIIHCPLNEVNRPGRPRGLLNAARRGTGRRAKPEAWKQVFLKEGYEALNILREIIAEKKKGATLSLAGVLHVIAKARPKSPAEWRGKYPSWLWNLYVTNTQDVDILFEEKTLV